MSARTTANGGPSRDRDHGGRTCNAPSCWEPGQPVAIVGDDDDDDEPVLCETHRKAYLGVSS